MNYGATGSRRIFTECPGYFRRKGDVRSAIKKATVAGLYEEGSITTANGALKQPLVEKVSGGCLYSPSGNGNHP